jgi:hypothetical protein
MSGFFCFIAGYHMNLIDIIQENRLATTSAILGLLAIAIFLLLPGVINVYLFLGIPAIVTGAVSLVRLKKKRVHSHMASVVLPIAGISLGVLSMFIVLLTSI